MRFRRSFWFFGWLLLAGCAHVEPPRGGPEDRIPPGLVATTPTTDTILAPFDGPVVFQFDERISQERLEEAVSVSPRTSPVEVRHGRSSIRVSLRNGWGPDQIYHVTVNPSVRDLFGNPLAEAETVVFSTGPEIPETRLTGVVVDGLTGRPIRDIRVEAIRSPDSLVYAVQTDSAGGFVLDRFPVGGYRVRSFEDTNRNRSLELFEPSDSTDVTIEAATPVAVRLRLLETDSTAAVIASVDTDSLLVELTFDDYLDPAQTIEAGQISLSRADGVGVEVDSARVVAGAGSEPAEAALPSRILEVYLREGSVLEPSVEYEVRVAAIRNVNGVSGDAESSFEPPEPPPPPELPEDADADAAIPPAASGAVRRLGPLALATVPSVRRAARGLGGGSVQ